MESCYREITVIKLSHHFRGSIWCTSSLPLTLKCHSYSEHRFKLPQSTYRFLKLFSHFWESHVGLLEWGAPWKKSSWENCTELCKVFSSWSTCKIYFSSVIFNCLCSKIILPFVQVPASFTACNKEGVGDNSLQQCNCDPFFSLLCF